MADHSATTEQSATPESPQPVVHVHMSNVNTAAADAAAKATATAAATAPTPAPPPPPTRKRLLGAYLALVVGWWAAQHRFYLRRPAWSWLLMFYLLPFFVFEFAQANGLAAAFAAGISLFFPLGLLVIDAFAIPGWVRNHNALVDPLQPSAAAIASAADQPSAPPPLPTSQTPAEAPRPGPRPHDLRTRLLHAAHQGDGKLTVTQGVMQTGEKFEKVQRCLRKMVRAGYIDMDNHPDSGVIVYLFPELVGRPAPADSPPSPDPERV